MFKRSLFPTHYLTALSQQRVSHWQVLRQRHEFAELLPERLEILVHITAQAIRDFARRLGIFIHDLLEGELRVVKRIHQLAHVLDTVPHETTVAGKPFRREILFDDGLVYFLRRQRAAFEGEHQATAEHWIEKRESIA